MIQILSAINNLNLGTSTLIAKQMCKQMKVKFFQNINRKIQLFNNLLILNIEALTLWWINLTKDYQLTRAKGSCLIKKY